MPMYYYPGWSSTGMTVWMVLSTLFWLALAAVIVWALIHLATRTTRGTGMPFSEDQQSATEILKTRYARGEIDSTTFREMMAKLTEYEEVPPSREVQQSASANGTPFSHTPPGVPTGLL